MRGFWKLRSMILCAGLVSVHSGCSSPPMRYPQLWRENPAFQGEQGRLLFGQASAFIDESGWDGGAGASGTGDSAAEAPTGSGTFAPRSQFYPPQQRNLPPVISTPPRFRPVPEDYESMIPGKASETPDPESVGDDLPSPDVGEPAREKRPSTFDTLRDIFPPPVDASETDAKPMLNRLPDRASQSGPVASDSKPDAGK